MDTTLAPLVDGQRVHCRNVLGAKNGTVVGDTDVEHRGAPHRAVRFDKAPRLMLVPVDWLEPHGKKKGRR